MYRETQERVAWRNRWLQKTRALPGGVQAWSGIPPKVSLCFSLLPTVGAGPLMGPLPCLALCTTLQRRVERLLTHIQHLLLEGGHLSLTRV